MKTKKRPITKVILTILLAAIFCNDNVLAFPENQENENNLVVSVLTKADVSCFGSADGSVTLTASGGVLPYTYAWSNATANATNINLAAGAYIATVTDFVGATATFEVAIEEPPALELALVSQTNIDCNSLTGAATIVAEGGAGEYVYLWSNGSVEASAENLPVGANVCTVTDENGCTQSISVMIEENLSPPIIEMAANPDLHLDCEDEMLQLGPEIPDTSNLTYLWTTATGQIMGSANTNSVNVVAAGTYQLVVTNSATGCSATELIQITEDLNRPHFEIMTEADLTIGCNETSVVLETTMPEIDTLVYFWTTANGSFSGNANGNSIEAEAEGTYEVLIINDEGCRSMQSVEVTVNQELPIVEIDTSVTVDLELDCVNNILQLDGSASSTGPNFIPTWATIEGNVLLNANTLIPTVSAAGTYDLTITNLENGCSSTASVEVSAIAELPEIYIEKEGDLILGCGDTSVELNAVGSSTGSNITHLWATVEGNISAGADSTMATVTAAGTYQFFVTNEDNNCTSIASVEVVLDTLIPEINIETQSNLQIDCNHSEVILDASASANGENLMYAWTSANGNITAGTDELMATANAAGSYEIEITNLENNCTNTATVEVTADLEAPNVEISTGLGGALQLDCINNTLTLNGNVNAGAANFTHLWTTANGNFVAGTNGLTPIIGAAGTYELLVTNEENGCTSTSSVEVMADANLPTIEIEANAALELNCNTTSIEISGTASTNGGGNLTYLWTTLDGNISANTSTNSITANAAGTYQLLVTNEDTGCSSMEVVEVTANLEFPEIEIAGSADLQINCNNSEVSLSASANGNNLISVWTTANGNIMTGANSMTAIANAAGTYQIEITNPENGCFSIETVEVTANLEFPEIEIEGNADLQIDCNNSEVSLSASANGNNLISVWTTTNGNITTGANTMIATANAAGTYQIEITNPENGCSSIETIEVMANLEIPEIEIAGSADLQINCNNSEVSLSASANGNNLISVWTTTNGNITAGANSINATANAAGIYQIEITNPENGCSSIETIEVTANLETPTVEIEAELGAELQIDCINSTLTLNGNVNAGNSNFTHLWTSANGNFVAGTTGLNPVVSAAGTYELLITNEENGCTSSATVEVEADENLPIIEISSNEELQIDCNTSEVNIASSTTANSSNISYLWSTLNGSISTNPTQNSITANAAGTYQLLVTNEDNGCASFATVEVTADFEAPEIIIENSADLEINCNDSEVNIIASANGNDLVSAWTTANGNITAGANSMMATANATGSYQIEVTNPENGCSSTETIEITANLEAPEIEIEGSTDLEINCNNSEVSLSASATGNDLVSVWTTANGNITTGTNSMTATANAAGSYQIEVTNPENGCSSIEMVEVTANFEMPEIEIENSAALEIDCNNSEVSLSASANGNDLISVWTTANGNITAGANSMNATANAAGEYQIEITNPENGCSSVETVEVTANLETPIITIQNSAALEIDCNNSEVSLTAFSNSQNFVSTWTTANGNITAGANSMNATANAAGEYQIEITNPENGCSSIEMVEVTANLEAPEISVENNSNLEIDCNNSEVSLSASANGIDFISVWTTADGNITTGANSMTATANAAGAYQIEITNPENGCSSIETVEVTANLETPTVEIEAAIGSDLQIDCINNNVTLNGVVNTNGSVFLANWTSANGNIVAGANGLNPVVNAAGNYELVITNIENGCSTSAQVEVTADASLPMIEMNPEVNLELNCNETEVIIEASATANASNLIYVWTTLDGNITSNANSNSINANSAGTYQLQVTNGDNGCSAVANVEVTANFEEPEMAVEASADAQIDCNNSEITMEVSTNGNDENLAYVWTTANGNITTGANSAMATANAAGAYQIEITNLENGCTATETVEITANLETPTVEIEVDENLELNCVNSTLALNGNVNAGSANFTSLWTTANGNIMAGANGLNPVITAAGTYELLITNEENGCTASAEIEITADESLPTVEIAANADLELNCDNTEIVLEGSASGNSAFAWTTLDGNITTNANTNSITAAAAGTYQLEVTNNENGCTAIATVEVTGNFETPEIQIENAADLQIDCNNEEVSLSASANGDDLVFVWTTANGNITAGANSMMATANAAGGYQVEVTNLENGCTTIETVEVDLNMQAPTANAGTAMELNCNNMFVALDGSASSQGTNFSYEWTTTNGNIIMNANTSSAFVDAEGSYTLVVTNEENGCTAIAQTSVSNNITLPGVSAVASGNLNCENSSVLLDATATADGNLVYSWSTPNGNIVAGANTLTPEVNAAGTYTFSVVDNDTGCANSASVEVILDTETPTADAGLETQIDCNNETIELNGSASSQGNNYTYFWTTANGNIEANANTLHPTVNASGEYTLVVTNQTNGCSAESTVFVDENMEMPVAEATVNGMIGCENSTLIIDATTSSQNGNFDYEWTTSAGVIASGATTLTPTVNAAGNYTLVVTNLENGCSAEVSVAVEGQPDLELNIQNVNSTSCATAADGEVSVEVSGGTGNYTFTWSNGANTATNSGLAAGNYGLTITDEGGCQATAVVEVAAPAALEIELNATAETAVNAENGTASVNVTGGTPPYSFSWSNGFSAQSIFNLSPNIYTVFVTDANGCEAQVSVEIEAFDDCPIEIAVQSSDSACGGASGEISLDVTGANGEVSYSWSNGMNSANIANLEGGIYTVVVLDELGCEATATVELAGEDNTPPVVLTQNITVVLDESGNAAIDAEMIAEGSYDNCSSVDAGLTFALSTSQFDCSMVGENEVIVLVMDENGNSATASAMVTVVDETEPIVHCPTNMEINSCGGQINYQVPTIEDNCENTTANFTLVAGLPSGSIFPQGQTTVSYVGVISTGQITECSFDINLTGEGLEAEIFVTPPSCAGEIDAMATVEVEGGTGNYNYLWINANGQTSATATGLAAGEYTVIVADEGGCSVMVTAEIEEVNPVNVDLIFLKQDCEGGGSIDITISGGTSLYDFAWFNAEGNFMASTEDLEEAESGIYDVEITDANGCNEVFAGIEVDFINGTVNWVRDLGEMLIAPNPTDGFSELTVELQQSAEIRVEVLNMLGQSAIEAQVATAQNHTFDLDLTGLTSGNYLVRVLVNGNFFRQEILNLNN